jgi:phosphatidylglycerol:prolipoprotein diacylglycerol transferase|tara:strand:- start:97 stop:933 length:837 start_codon:yes stop_codon:yes gene_type:complete
MDSLSLPFSLAALTFPDFDPVIVQFGPLAIRWYALAYVIGLILGWQYCRWLTRQNYFGKGGSGITELQIDDFLLWATLGVVLGGRLGYILFYKPGYYLANPIEIFYVWQGGMAFHGGLLGVIVAVFLFARKYKISYFRIMDITAVATPIGLGLGRIANFINGELVGRVTDVPWAVIFPRGGPDPRHPSQLYQAGLEGLLLLVVFFFLARGGALAYKGMMSGYFLLGYGLARLVGELFRQPDAHLGFIFGPITMGQLLSIPMVLGGLFLVYWSKAHKLA